ncbi:MAG: DUF881 domain-containing protein [Clostridium sp.]|uniref:DUF881 domain-containing protein n=1 Tax=Clostridium sp. TaxID=1506 RepID=UPI0025C65E66|nr:DUF881 domain-containing protein [Clostridium sp.]MCH3964187.1 DUF881 domain-containing protein [Clostridium sp.]MCI1715368.1 DUF881 domain-containing protein [Clostridium sp.]MCI1799841.1 DUF881 domain-containing protein [Clostridium sp.]MCI1813551.1 DUF881 domain-containing protein [Clostridium sp.]MCI1870659.1 DUF881 domain-containing protein [Clostridium sp.]
MRKFASQISIFIVCGILGFMLAYQSKVLMNQDNTLNLAGNNNSTDITVEIERYKTQKQELEKKVDELQGKVKKYEDAAASTSASTKNLLDELEDTRILTGETDVKGPGIIIYITPSSSMFGNNLSENVSDKITDKHLAYLVNELRFAGAEAISINDIRIVSNTGIRTAGNYILINNDEKISPSSRIVIEAIGDQKLLYSDMSFPEVFADFKNLADIKFEKKDNISIKKYNKTYKLQYARPVKD